MVYHGRLHGRRIELDETPAIPEGSRVRVNLLLEAGSLRSSPEAVLRLAGTLSDAEAETILRGSQECRQVDASLWSELE